MKPVQVENDGLPETDVDAAGKMSGAKFAGGPGVDHDGAVLDRMFNSSSLISREAGGS